MASKTLDVSIILKAGDPINGILTLDKNIDDTITYDDEGVTSDTATIAHGAATELVTTGVGVHAYVYIKNTDISNYIKVQTSGAVNYGAIHPGDFSFFCVKEGEGLKVQANVADCIIEYITFNKA